METPKEVAKRLVDKFTEVNGNRFFAKDCALITVDEMIKESEIYGFRNRERIPFLQEVKTEIEKL